MEENLKLPVTYKGQDFEFPFEMVHQGYSYRFAVQIKGVEVSFEKDDEGEFRALIKNPNEVTEKLPESELLKVIAEVLKELTE